MSHSIYQWIKQGLVNPEQQQQALEIAGERASRSDWLVFNKQFMVVMGVLSLAVGVVFFFAFNWNEIPRLYKFLTLEVLLVAFFVAYYFKSKSFWMAQALLLGAVIVLGALLALFGQTYQTGADPWQLFATWAGLIMPLVLLARSEVLWIFWAALLNLALGLYLQVHHGFFGLWFDGSQMAWIYLLVNGVLLVWLESLSSQSVKATSIFGSKFSLKHRWAAQLVGMLVLFIATTLGVDAIWDRSNYRVLNTLIFFIMMTSLFLYYRYKARDLLLLTTWALALIVYFLVLLANSIFDDLDAAGFLLMAVSLIGMSTLAVRWIKQTHELFQQERLS